MNLIRCREDKHSEAILSIFNEAILNSTALYDYKPRTLDNMSTWFETKTNGNYPVLGIEHENGDLMGFASFGTFRAWPAYKYTVEHSIYVASTYRGQGIGRLLLTSLIETAQSLDYHTLIGGIDASNIASITLHEKLGFTHCGTLKQVGFKFGRWLDLAFYQRVLVTPEQPTDG